MAPRVAVIIAAYNAEAFIGRALDSVRRQTRAADAVLVVDDASTDDTGAAVERLGADWPALRLIRSPANAGPSSARNRGLAAAAADWVAVLDADDAWEPDRLARLLDVAERSGADFVADNQVLYDAVARRKGRVGFEADWDTRDLAASDLFLNDIVRPNALNYGLLKPMLRLDFLRRHGLGYREDMRYGEDFFLTAEVLLKGGRAVLTSYPGYIYTTRVGEHSKALNPFSHSVPRFDLLIAASDELEATYGPRLSAADRAAIRARRAFLAATHQSNVARSLRRARRYPAFALYVLRHPPLLRLLLARTAERLRPAPAGGRT